MATVKHPALHRLLEPLVCSLTPKAARALLGFRADPVLQVHIGELADKCNEGELTPEERAEYEAYVGGMDLIAILQS
jgi:hypothetical protein